MKKLFILGLLCLFCFTACNHESNLSQSDNTEISENEDTPQNNDLSNVEPSITLSEEKEENNGFDFETYLNSNDIISITQVSLGDEGDKYCSVYEFLYKSDECKVVGFISIPNECIEKKIPYPCMIYNRGGNRDFASKRSAINWADEINIPVLIFHSKYDARVAFSQSQRMANTLKKSGKDYTFITHDDGKHASLHKEDWETIRNWLNGEKEKQ